VAADPDAAAVLTNPAAAIPTMTVT
jgi:hypothetical protein